MIRRANERHTDHIDGMRGGKGTLHNTLLLQDGEFCGKGRLFSHGVLPPGSSVGVHTHTGDFEVYYILEGKGLYSDNGKEVTVGAGDVTICPEGECHGLENVGDTDLHYIALILFTK